MRKHPFLKNQLPLFRRQCEALNNKAKEFNKYYKKYDEGFKKITNNLNDPKANLDVAIYLCFIKGDWERGIHYLANSKKPELTKLAELEKEKPAQAKTCMQLGYKWLREGLSYEEGKIYERALYWFEKSIPGLQGTDKKKSKELVKSLKNIIKKGYSAFNNPKFVIAAYLIFADQAIYFDDFTSASAFVKKANNIAKSIKSKILEKERKNISDEIVEIERSFKNFKRSSDNLEKNNDSERDNSIVGEYLCFKKGCWDEGLPMLRKGIDKKLSPCAVMDLNKPSTIVGKAAVADEWCKIMKGRKGIEKRNIEERIKYWYKQVLPRINDLPNYQDRIKNSDRF